MKKQMRLKTLCVLTATMLFTLVSCDKEPTEYRPDLPPLESLVMDFSDFSSQPVGAKSTESYVNFVLAYTTVSYWSARAFLVSALPVAAYTEALSQSPEYLGDNVWEWSFNFTFNTQTYLVTLTGTRLNNEEFSMEMVISPAATPEVEVKWFDGVIRYDHTSANWNLYMDGQVVIEVAWNKDFETEAADLTYTYVEPDKEETGSYIMWEHRPEEVYDAAYTISMSDGMTNIEWNLTSIEGRIQSMGYYQDENWHCWVSLANGLEDIACE